MPAEELPAGKDVFFLSQTGSWVLGKVKGTAPPQKRTPGSPSPGRRSPSPSPGGALVWYRVQDEGGEEHVVPGDAENIYAYVSGAILEENPRDLLELSELHEGPLLRVVRHRYERDTIYTFIGRMVLALNPFTFGIPHYQEGKMADYVTPGADAMQRGSALLPHTWSLGRAAYDDMRARRANQTLLVSGESGAGKTETVKALLKFLGRLSTERAGDPDGTSARLQAAIQAASPILEAFGNAKTERNDNSSRFGKFLQVQFGGDGRIVGAKTDIYLLEKSRVVCPSSNYGRVYHSFHQLLCNPEACAKLNLGPASAYPGASKNPKIQGVDDGADFVETNKAMTEVGLTDAQRDQVWACVAGILHLQRVAFKPGPSDSSVVAPEAAEFVQNAAKCWGIAESAALEKELLTTTVRMGKDVVTRNNKPQVAESARDSICKEVYTHLFDWLVTKINARSDHPDAENVIGLLDIFGFEAFEQNGFEQLCINLANEMLQKHYNDHIFKADQQECTEEGIDVSHISYQDNQDTVELIGKKGSGILAVLDDQCKTHPEKDEDFLEKVCGRHAKHRSFHRGPLDHGRFAVQHYAGLVTYQVAGMGLKNAESLKEGVVDVLRGSDSELMRELLGGIDLSGKKTASSRFREQLNSLIQLINSTEPSWVRCIKPNPEKQPRKFHPVSVCAQLRCSGVLDTIMIRKAGYPVRPPLDGFVGRYRCLLKEVPPRGADLGATARRILSEKGLERGSAQVGKTKIFLKNAAATHLEEERRAALMEHQLRIVRQCKAEQRTRAAVGEACRRRWFLAMRMVEQAAEQRRGDASLAELEARKAIADGFQQEAAAIAAKAGQAAAPVAAGVAEAQHIDPARLPPRPPGLGDISALLDDYRPMPPPPSAPRMPRPEYRTYLLFSRGPWPVYEKPRPGAHMMVDGKLRQIEPLTVVEAHDTSQDTGEPEDTAEWLRLRDGGWVMRRGQQADAKAGDDWRRHGFDPCPDPASLPAFGPPPSSWHNRDGRRVQRMGDYE